MTSSVKEKLNDIKTKDFSNVNFIATKVVSDSWKVKLNKLFVAEGAEGLRSKIGLNEGDALFIVRGKKHDAVRRGIFWYEIVLHVIFLSMSAAESSGKDSY